MKQILLTTLISAWAHIVFAQNDFHIEAGATVVNEGQLTIIDGNFANFSSNIIGGSLKMEAADGNDYTLGSLAGRESFDQLTMWGPGKISLLAPTSIDDELILNLDVDLDLTTSNMNLQPSARILGEDEINTITGATGSFITTTKYHEIGIIQDFGGIGVTITSENIDLLDTEVTRHYGNIMINGQPAVFRYYEIHTESQLLLFKSDDGSTDWTEEGGIVDENANTITLNGIRSFSFWAMAEGNATLPVELVFFDAEAIDNNAVLCTWQTATEVNNSHFEIERSEDGSEFEYVGRENGSGSSNVPTDYHFTDDSPYTGESYYRLRQVDFDGSSDYSEIRRVYIDKSTGIILFPNPAEEIVHVSVPKDVEVDSYSIYNSIGQTVQSGDVSTASQLDLNVSALPHGMYVLDLQLDGKSIKQLKLIKQ